MEARPRLKIDLSAGDKMVEATCLMILLFLWIGTIAFYSALPDQIPSHYNAFGEADGFSNKTSIFFLPGIASIIYIGMTILNKHPHIYNYSQTLTAENAKRLYTSTTKVIRMLKLAVVVIFSGIVFVTYKTSLSNTKGPGVWFLPLVLTLMILPNIYFLKSSRKTST